MSTTIRSVGVVIRLCCITPKRLGLYEHLRLTKNCSPIMQPSIGFLNILKMDDLADGCEKEGTGHYPVKDIGGHHSQFGSAVSVTTKPPLALLKNWRNCLSVLKILIT